MQVLQVMNPRVTYSMPSNSPSESNNIRCKGVAVNLKEFVDKLKKHHIPNDGEKSIRMKLREHSRCETRKKQYFNIPGSKKLMIERSEKGSVRCLTGVCVPADEFPHEVFDILQGNEEQGILFVAIYHAFK